MSSPAKKILEEEVAQLERLHGLMLQERECLARMDRESLLRLTREKEALALGIERLAAAGEGLDEGGRGSLSEAPATARLVRARRSLLLELRDLSRTHKEMIDAQREQVEHLLGFLRNLQHPSATYDHKGNLSRP